MADIWSKEKRSAVMANIRGVTAPERHIRAVLAQRGIKGFQLETKILGIKPDIVFADKKIAVFIDGCFWHGCPRCYVQPKTHTVYWSNKVKMNIRRDHRQRHNLRQAGWHVIRIWECRLEQNPIKQVNRILRLLKRDEKE